MIGRWMIKGLAVVAALTGLMFAGISTASASNEQLDLTITNSWFLTSRADDPELYEAVQVQSPAAKPVTLSAALNKDGSFTIPADQFNFNVTQNLGFQTITYGILSKANILGTYDADTGAVSMDVARVPCHQQESVRRSQLRIQRLLGQPEDRRFRLRV